ncbi:hypothetical protein ACQ86N_31400 [Puia sp. P3]|uniref:hypothetical protein n=1 Tax=Puia sp. P3 TaxID=3423952 RepID=UPI003D66FBD2
MKVNILVIGRDRAILEVVERLINSHEDWKATSGYGRGAGVCGAGGEGVQDSVCRGGCGG